MPADSGLERGFHNEIDLYAEQFAQMLSKRCKQPSQQAVGHSVRRLIGLRNHNNTTIIGTRRCVYRHPTLRLLTKNHILLRNMFSRPKSDILSGIQISGYRPATGGAFVFSFTCLMPMSASETVLRTFTNPLASSCPRLLTLFAICGRLRILWLRHVLDCSPCSQSADVYESFGFVMSSIAHPVRNLRTFTNPLASSCPRLLTLFAICGRLRILWLRHVLDCSPCSQSADVHEALPRFVLYVRSLTFTHTSSRIHSNAWFLSQSLKKKSDMRFS